VRLTEGGAEYFLEEAHRRKNEGRVLPRRLTEEERTLALKEGLEMKRQHERATYHEFRG